MLLWKHYAASPDRESRIATLQHSTELLVVTLAHTLPNRETDALAHIRFIGETLRSATGLVTSYFYRSREQRPYYLLLSTWEDEESWQQARERYDPRALLLTRPDLLAALPEQWHMRYRWGYSRPARLQTVATTHIATVRADAFEATHTAWLQELRKQATQFTFTFSFLAYGIADTHLEQHTTANEVTEKLNADSIKQGHVLLTFISWPSDAERIAFYSSNDYQRMSALLEQKSHTYMLTLDPP
jgi:quinol monooxygenase YgiN